MNPFAENFRTVSDIVLTDARIIDGTGAPSFRGCVSVKNGKIEEVSRNGALDADEVVDVGGAVLVPGFIEAYSRSDFGVLEGPFFMLKLYQEITTEILGQNGLDSAPVLPRHTDEWPT